MEITYILGNNKSNKTTAIIDIAKKFQDENENVVVIVPEQTTLSTEKRLVDKIGSILNIQVYSFMRLSNKVFSESSIRNVIKLDETGKHMLLKLIVSKNADNFKFYKNGVNKAGFIFELGQFLTEFYSFKITISDITNVISDETIDETLRLKLYDIRLILKEYNDYVKNNFISTDSTLDLLATKIDDSLYLKDINVIIDGFYGLTEQEYSVLEKLVKKVKSITITHNVNVTKKVTGFDNLNKYDPYYEPKKMMNKITQIIKDSGQKIDNVVLLQPIINENEDLEFLKQNFLPYKCKEIYEKEVENIEINACKNKMYEVSLLAKKIVNYTNKGYNFNDIKVVCGNIESYKDIINGIFTEYEIPYFIDVKDSIDKNSLTLLIQNMLNVVLTNYSFNSVISLLKIDLFSNDTFSYKEIEIFENYLLEYGIKGYYFQKEFLQGEKNKRYDLETINNTRLLVVDKVESFSKDIKINKKYTVKDLSKKIFDFLEYNNIEEKIKDIIIKAELSYDFKMKNEFLQIYEKIVNIFEKVVDILGDEEVSLQEFSDIIDEGIMAQTLGIIPLSQNEVTIGDVYRSKFQSSKIIFIVGAEDDYFPAKIQEKSIINDNDREAIKPIINNINSKSEMYLKENLLIYDILLTGYKKVIVSYPYYTFSGDQKDYSPLIKKLLSLFSNLGIKIDSHVYITNKKTMFSYINPLIQKRKSNSLTEKELEFINYYETDEIYKEKVNSLQKMVTVKNDYQYLPKNIIDKLYKESMETSISKLEKFSKCPFSYFLEYNLFLKDRKEAEVNSIDIGTVFHEILDRFTIILKFHKKDYNMITEEEISDIVDEIVENLQAENYLNMFNNSNRYMHYLERIKRICKKSIFALCTQLSYGEFEIFDTEIEFGKDKITKIVVDLGDNKTLELTGKVDRVDIYEDGEKRYVKIVDYKSSKKKFIEEEVMLGTQLQLLTYLDVLIKNGEEIFGSAKFNYLPGGIYYFEIQDPKIVSEEVISKDEIKRKILQKFRLSGKTNSNIELVTKIDSKILPKEKSDIINVSLTKDFEVTKRSEVYSEEEFADMQNKVTEKIKEIGKQIFSGDISVNYDRSEQLKACKYCDFSGICKRDVRIKE